MAPAFFFIAIMGCGEAEAPCEQVGRTQVQYESFATCTAATDAAMREHGDIPYPVVVAQCQPGNKAAAALMPQDVKLPPAEQSGHSRYASVSDR